MSEAFKVIMVPKDFKNFVTNLQESDYCLQQECCDL